MAAEATTLEPAARWKRAATRRNAELAALAAAWGILRFVFADVADDAFITWRYARNLVDGLGFVFNPGEVVYGTTAPWFGFFNVLGMLLGIEPWTWTLGWDVVWGTGILWRLRQVFDAAGDGRWFPLGGLLVVCASFSTLPTAGMETGLYSFLILGALSTAARNARPWIPVAWGTAAAMLRPDGVIVLAVAGAFALAPLVRRERWREAARSAWPVLALAVHAAILLVLFDDLVPQTVRAKAARVETWEGMSTAADLLADFFLDWSGYPQAIAFAGLAGLVLGAVRSPVHRVVAAYAAAHAAVFAIGRAPAFPWYLTPVFILLYAYAAPGLGWGFTALWHRRGSPAAPPPIRPPFAPAFATAAALILSLPQVYWLGAWHGVWGLSDFGIRTDLKRYRLASEFILEHSDGEVPWIAAIEIGMMGYYSGARIYDTEGLVTPEAAEKMQWGKSPWDILGESGAPWFVFSFAAPEGGEPGYDPEEDPFFTEITSRGYDPVARFLGDRWPVATYVFRRSPDARGTGSESP